MEISNFRNNSKCLYNDKGFFKFRDQCRKQHFNVVCEIKDCDKSCRGRHPKPCKNEERCRFLAKNICAYKHVILAHDDDELANLKKEVENLKSDNKRKKSEIIVITKELNYFKNQLKNDNDDSKEESAVFRDQIEYLKTLNDELLKENEYLRNVNVDLLKKLRENRTTNETLEEDANPRETSIFEDLNCKLCNFRARSHPGLKTHIAFKVNLASKMGNIRLSALRKWKQVV